MADTVSNDLKDSAEAYAKAVDAKAGSEKAAEKAGETVTTAAAPAKTASKAGASPAVKLAKAKKAVSPKARKKPAKRVARRVSNTKTKAAPKIARSSSKRKETMTKTNNFKFAGFESMPAFAPFQGFFANAGERGQEFVSKGQKVAEEMADLTRANVEAFVEAGQVAVEGARTVAQDFVANGRDSVEKAADAVRTLAEAKSPTEYLQLQGEFARASFDRMIADSSKMTEKMVKLAGEAFQPIQSRASANAEKLNTLVA